jgi:hypothetical protein
LGSSVSGLHARPSSTSTRTTSRSSEASWTSPSGPSRRVVRSKGRPATNRAAKTSTRRGRGARSWPPSGTSSGR